jgi:thiamine biosynthesis lipoprotein
MAVGSRAVSRVLTAAGALLLVTASLGCGPHSTGGDAPIVLTGPTMGTWYTIKLEGLPEGLTQAQVGREIEDRLTQINALMSTYDPASELSRFNASEGSEWFPVSPETATVVAAGQAISEETDGAFDMTVGPLVNLWNFGPNAQPDRLPDALEIAAASARVGFRRLEVRRDPPGLRKTRADLYVDLSAIAKGYAVDEIARGLDRHGVKAYMVEIGGEVRTRGRKGNGEPWRIGIEKPITTDRVVTRVVQLVDCSLATSGDYRNYFEVQGKRFSHEIDPQTGKPVEHALASVSVLAEDCMTADAAATAIMVLGPERGLAYARRAGLEVLLIQRSGGQFEETATLGFEAVLVDGVESTTR